MATAHDGQMTTAEIVARNLARELADQRWSARQAAFKLGLNPMYVTRRANGEVECTASDLVMFAGLLDIPVMKLLLLPEMDSNHQPAGFSPAPEPQAVREVVSLADRQRHPSKPVTGPAIVSQMRTGA